NMRAFGTKISSNQQQGHELSERVRHGIIGVVESGASTREAAEQFGMSQRNVQRTIKRWNKTSSNTSRPRSGRPPVLLHRQRQLLLCIAKRFPKIEYQQL
ncbi:hypothetical protein EJ02DRAFT_325934, partial [Clathrospora elynae]